MSRDLISTPVLRAHLEIMERVDRNAIRTHRRREYGEPDLRTRESLGTQHATPAETARRRAQILAWRSEKPFPVMLRVIAERLQISKMSVQKHISALKAAGLLPEKKRVGKCPA